MTCATATLTIGWLWGCYYSLHAFMCGTRICYLQRGHVILSVCPFFCCLLNFTQFWSLCNLSFFVCLFVSLWSGLNFSLLSPLPSIRQWVMVIVWRLRGNIIRTALCWIVWIVHSLQHTYVSSSNSSNKLVCHIGTLTLCIQSINQSISMNLLWCPTSKALGCQKYNENTTASHRLPRVVLL